MQWHWTLSVSEREREREREREDKQDCVRSSILISGSCCYSHDSAECGRLVRSAQSGAEYAAGAPVHPDAAAPEARARKAAPRTCASATGATTLTAAATASEPAALRPARLHTGNHDDESQDTVSVESKLSKFNLS